MYIKNNVVSKPSFLPEMSRDSLPCDTQSAQTNGWGNTAEAVDVTTMSKKTPKQQVNELYFIVLFELHTSAYFCNISCLLMYVIYF